MKFLFKYPTYRRPEWFKKTLETYHLMLSGDHEYQFIISMNDDDETMNNIEMRNFLINMNVKYFYGNHANKIAACNADLENLDFDILFLISDDMIPIVHGFDNAIANDMLKYFPNLDGALHYPDGFCNIGIESAITLTIMGKKLYDHIGYVYHPDYKSFFCDNEFRDVVYSIGKAKFISGVLVQHDWRGQEHKEIDEVYKRNNKIGKVDEATYNRRKKLGFPK